MRPQRYLRFLVALVTFSLNAHADVPPVPGMKRVPVRYKITEIPHGDVHLWAVPCGADEDTKNQWFELKEGEPYTVGRYANGACDVFAIGHEQFVARLTAREESGPNWVADAKAASVRCEGLTNLYFQHEVPEKDAHAYDDVSFRVAMLSPKECKLVMASGPPVAHPRTSTIAPTKSRCGCALTRAEDALAPGLLVSAALVLRRRRRR